MKVDKTVNYNFKVSKRVNISVTDNNGKKSGVINIDAKDFGLTEAEMNKLLKAFQEVFGINESVQITNNTVIEQPKSEKPVEVPRPPAPFLFTPEIAEHMIV